MGTSHSVSFKSRSHSTRLGIAIGLAVMFLLLLMLGIASASPALLLSPVDQERPSSGLIPSTCAEPGGSRDVTQSTQLEGVWRLVTTFSVSYTSPNTCTFLNQLADPYIVVTQTGNQLYADEQDPGSYSLRGVIVSNSVVFTTTGWGFTIGAGGPGCSVGSRDHRTTYSGDWDQATSKILGEISGQAEYKWEWDVHGDSV